jgi:hypothetical protein
VIWLCRIAKRLLAILQQPIAEHMLAILATSYRFKETIELVAFVRLGGVNNVFSHVSLILVATFSISAKLLLTNFLALVHHTCAPMFLEQNAWVSQSKTLAGNLVVASLLVNFSFSGFFADGFCCECPLD